MLRFLLWMAEWGFWKCVHTTSKLFMKNGSVPLECLMNKILWLLLLLLLLSGLLLYGRQQKTITHGHIGREIKRSDPNEPRIRAEDNKKRQANKWMGESGTRRKQINMKNARVWHFVVYKLIYEAIRVFALQLFQQHWNSMLVTTATTTLNEWKTWKKS